MTTEKLRCPTCKGTNVSIKDVNGWHTCFSCDDKFANSAVHYNNEPGLNWLGEMEPEGWYFWDETWASRIGPYSTYDEAKHMMERYAKEVLDGAPPDHLLKSCMWCGTTSNVHTGDCR